MQFKQLKLMILSGLVAAGLAQASNVTVTTTVSGTQGPWDPSLNPAFVYGQGYLDNNPKPDVVSGADGLSFTAGDVLTVQYVSGQVNTGFGYSDANGQPPFLQNYPGEPGHYTGSGPVYQNELLGTFADNGVIVGNPFVVGNGPTALTVPVGANELDLGVNDTFFTDNLGAFVIDVTGPGGASPGPGPGPASTPEPASMLLLGSGLFGIAGWRKLRRA